MGAFCLALQFTLGSDEDEDGGARDIKCAEKWEQAEWSEATVTVQVVTTVMMIDACDHM